MEVDKRTRKRRVLGSLTSNVILDEVQKRRCLEVNHDKENQREVCDKRCSSQQSNIDLCLNESDNEEPSSSLFGSPNLPSNQNSAESLTPSYDARCNNLLKARRKKNNSSSARSKRMKQVKEVLNQCNGSPTTPSTNGSRHLPRKLNLGLSQPAEVIPTQNNQDEEPNLVVDLAQALPYRSRKEVTLPELKKKFLAEVKDGPTSTCCSCGGLFYLRQTAPFDADKLIAKGKEEAYIRKLQAVSDATRICLTCKLSVSKCFIPRLHLSNGLKFPDIPEPLKGLTRLEEMCVSLRIPFAQIRPHGFQQQMFLKGNVVNVPNNLDISVRSIPRRQDELQITHLKFMRRMAYHSPYVYQQIRPFRVNQAAKYLLDTPLYKKENVVFSGELDEMGPGAVNFPIGGENEEVGVVTENDADDNVVFGSDNPSADETLILEDREYANLGIKMAPAEGNQPRPFAFDKFAEELSFPCSFAGNARNIPENVKLSYTDIAKSQLRMHDRRACTSERIFFAYKKSCNEKIADAIQICLRRPKRGAEREAITASQVNDPAFIEKHIATDNAYSVFKKIRGSPGYWKDQQKGVVAMMRQLGKCTFFLTLSAAETKWKDLLVILKKTVDKEDVTEEQVSDLSPDEIRRLIKSDPVTCARHFDHKTRAFCKHLLTTDNGVFRPYPINDWYSRVEYQARGSPHLHSLLYAKGAPEYNEDVEGSAETVCKFIDEFISCARHPGGELEDLVSKLQVHKHSHTCHKIRTTRKCRFNYPKPPMPATCILNPLEKSVSKKDKDAATKNYTKIEQIMESFKDNPILLSFDDFLAKLEMSKSEYMVAVRSSIKRKSVFLKRETDAAYVNAYNQDILGVWKANMDIQYVLDPYACARYCVSYISKAEGGLSKLLRAADHDQQKGNNTMKEKMSVHAKILISGTEIGGQEATSFILGMPYHFCSRVCAFINTNRRLERAGMLKPADQLKDLEEDSEEICVRNILDHYVNRPESLEDLCLADFVSSYNYKPKKSSRQNEEDDPSIPAQTDSPKSKKEWIELMNNDGFIQERTVRKIIRFRNFNKISQPEEYCREQLMLFVPWRNEDAELEKINSIAKAKEFEETIRKNSSPYYNRKSIDEDVFNGLIEEMETEEMEEENDKEEDVTNDMELDKQEEDLFIEKTVSGPSSNINSSVVAETFKPQKMFEDGKYYKIMRSLNQKQRQLVMHILYLLKTTSDPFYIFLTGQAGVGKSHAINAIVQSFLRYEDKFQREDPENITVIVAGPTGKSSFNVGGQTLHGAFFLPPNNSKAALGSLGPSKLNTIRVKLANVKLIIIDEISMVSAEQFQQINERLQEIFDTKEIFGGKPMIVVGDFHQLPPIGGSFIFQPPSVQRKNLVAINPLWEPFRMFVLDEIMRQQGDFFFCKALNNMAVGKMDEEDIRHIREREILSQEEAPVSAIRLFLTNKECIEFNKQIYEKLVSEGMDSVAFDVVHGTKKSKEELLKAAESFTAQESDGMPYQTYLKVGGVYFVTTNIDVSDGLFNGSTGILRYIEPGKTKTGVTVPIRAWMEFADKMVGVSRRDKFAHLRPAQLPDNLTPISRETRSIKRARRFGELELIRTQIPLQGANGMTVAKSQGSSLQHVVVNTTKKMKREALYVACSRATSKAGLFIHTSFTPPLPPEDPSTDPVTVEMERLRSTPFPLSLRYFSCLNNLKKIYFHNVENFPCYKKDLLSDPNITCSDLIVLVEPHTVPAFDVSIPGYECIFRLDGTKTTTRTNSEGCLVFVKSSMAESIKVQYFWNHKNGEDHFIILRINEADKRFMFFYRHPKYSLKEFLLAVKIVLDNDNVDLVIGDINEDMKRQNSSKIADLFKNFGFASLLNTDHSTTDYHTAIDICFGKMNSYTASLYETYYSYHKGICVSY